MVWLNWLGFGKIEMCGVLIFCESDLIEYGGVMTRLSGVVLGVIFFFVMLYSVSVVANNLITDELTGIDGVIVNFLVNDNFGGIYEGFIELDDGDERKTLLFLKKIEGWRVARGVFPNDGGSGVAVFKAFYSGGLCQKTPGLDRLLRSGIEEVRHFRHYSEKVVSIFINGTKKRIYLNKENGCVDIIVVYV